jgi:ribosome-associated heat shock protein Hsp15
MKSASGDARSDTTDTQRIDSWLWTSRFFRSRKLANEAVAGGHVWLNGQRCKPARAVKPGDELRIRRSAQEYVVIITGLSGKRLGAALAADLYRETDAGRAAREEREALMKAQRQGLRHARRRPGKRDRERMLRVKHQIPDWD